MLAIADTIGGSWPADVRKVALELSKDSEDADTFATKLFRALKEDFEGEGEDHDQGFQFSGDICSHLSADNEAPWASFPRQLTLELLARNLGRYKVKSERNVVGGTRGRGYYWKKLKPVFDRYL